MVVTEDGSIQLEGKRGATSDCLNTHETCSISPLYNWRSCVEGTGEGKEM